eukprot:764153-Hanusia_phi.AAC.10
MTRRLVGGISMFVLNKNSKMFSSPTTAVVSYTDAFKKSGTPEKVRQHESEVLGGVGGKGNLWSGQINVQGPGASKYLGPQRELRDESVANLNLKQQRSHNAAEPVDDKGRRIRCAGAFKA